MWTIRAAADVAGGAIAVHMHGFGRERCAEHLGWAKTVPESLREAATEVNPSQIGGKGRGRGNRRYAIAR